MQMESSTNRSNRRGGFMKGKLVMPFYKTSKPTTTSSSTSILSSTGNKVVKPMSQYSSSHHPYNPSTTTVSTSMAGYAVSSTTAKDYAARINVPQAINKKKVSFINSFPADEAVDMKAANYISCVQERFRLQGIGSERNISAMVPQDIQ